MQVTFCDSEYKVTFCNSEHIISPLELQYCNNLILLHHNSLFLKLICAEREIPWSLHSEQALNQYAGVGWGVWDEKEMLFIRKHWKKTWLQRALEKLCGIFKQKSAPCCAGSHNLYFMEHGFCLVKDTQKEFEKLYQKWKVSPVYSAYSAHGKC